MRIVVITETVALEVKELIRNLIIIFCFFTFLIDKMKKK
jgi:hypothetical protein